jgi:hypothetical protein
MAELEQMAATLRGDPMFSHDAAGNPIIREAACECGRRFMQTLLSERFLSIAERQSARAIAAVTEQIPGFFVPVHCPKCERIDLGHTARVAEARSVPDLPERAA